MSPSLIITVDGNTTHSLLPGVATLMARISKQSFKKILNSELICACGISVNVVTIEAWPRALCNKTRAPLHQLTAVTIDYCKQCLYNHHPLITPKLHFHRAPLLTSREIARGEITTWFKMKGLNRLTDLL